jgi:hypothetical protein
MAATMTTTPQMRAVETYLENGISVLPLRPGSKLPTGRWKRWQREHIDPATAGAWWNGIVTPIPGVGIITGPVSGGLAVLDIEPEHVDFIRSHVKLPDTGVVHTARGGLHVYCRGEVRSSKLAVDERTVGDIRGVGGYVVAPPTQMTSGLYSWALPADFRSLPDIPTWAAPSRISTVAVPASTLLRASRFQSDPLWIDLPSKVQLAILNPRPTSWSQWVYRIVIEGIWAGGSYEEIESILAESCPEYLHDRAHRRSDPGFLDRTYQNALRAVDQEVKSSAEVRVFDIAEFDNRVSLRSGPIARTRADIVLAVCGTPNLAQHRIPKILSDGALSGEYRQFCRAFGREPTDQLFYPKTRARAVIQDGIAVRLLRR